VGSLVGANIGTSVGAAGKVGAYVGTHVMDCEEIKPHTKIYYESSHWMASR
jgi:hypothetical protein